LSEKSMVVKKPVVVFSFRRDNTKYTNNRYISRGWLFSNPLFL
jgi:hypothetical protein